MTEQRRFTQHVTGPKRDGHHGGLWLAGLLLVAVHGAPAPGQEPESIRLERWSARARLVANPGPGTEVFLLKAEALWAPETPRTTGRHAIQVRLPGGQGLSRPLTPQESLGARYLDVYVPVSSVRNLRPEQVRIEAVVIDTSTGASVSNVIQAGITHFPTPSTGLPAPDQGPFGWGAPLPEVSAATLPRSGPDGLQFVRIKKGDAREGTSDEVVVFLALSEAGNAQVGDRLDGYEPPADRSDEFPLESGEQPAFGMTPAQAIAYCERLSQADSSGLTYRLPSREEWLHAARAGAETHFWWGESPQYPEGANFLGPEPALEIDATAVVVSGGASPAFAANPWGLFHTFGNVAEWVTLAAEGNDERPRYARLGGHFRTEPEVPLAEPTVDDAETVGEDLFVGVRPAFTLSARAGREAIEKAIVNDPRLAGTSIQVVFDPFLAIATLTGTVPEPGMQRLVDRQLATFWWLAAVRNDLTAPAIQPGQLALIEGSVGPASRSRVLDVILDTVPVSVRWADRLPVSGSDWWVNLYGPSGTHHAYKLEARQVAAGRTLPIHLDLRRLGILGAAPDSSVEVALSLGAPANTTGEVHLVSNMIRLPLVSPR